MIELAIWTLAAIASVVAMFEMIHRRCTTTLPEERAHRDHHKRERRRARAERREARRLAKTFPRATTRPHH